MLIMTFCLDSTEILFKLPEINYILKVAVKMFFKKRQLSQNRRHFKLAINHRFLLDDEKSVFLKWKRGRNKPEHKNLKSPHAAGGDGDCRWILSAQEGPAPSSANRSRGRKKCVKAGVGGFTHFGEAWSRLTRATGLDPGRRQSRPPAGNAVPSHPLRTWVV